MLKNIWVLLQRLHMPEASYLSLGYGVLPVEQQRVSTLTFKKERENRKEKKRGEWKNHKQSRKMMCRSRFSPQSGSSRNSSWWRGADLGRPYKLQQSPCTCSLHKMEYLYQKWEYPQNTILELRAVTSHAQRLPCNMKHGGGRFPSSRILGTDAEFVFQAPLHKVTWQRSLSDLCLETLWFNILRPF